MRFMTIFGGVAGAAALASIPFFVAVPKRVASQSKAPSAPPLFTSEGNAPFAVMPSRDAADVMEADSRDHPGGVREVALETEVRKAAPGKIRIGWKLGEPLQKGEEMTVRFWARSDARGRTLQARFSGASPASKAWKATLTDEWKEFVWTPEVNRSVSAEQSKIVFDCGGAAGRYVLTGIRVWRGSQP